MKIIITTPGAAAYSSATTYMLFRAVAVTGHYTMKQLTTCESFRAVAVTGHYTMKQLTTCESFRAVAVTGHYTMNNIQLVNHLELLQSLAIIQ